MPKVPRIGPRAALGAPALTSPGVAAAPAFAAERALAPIVAQQLAEREERIRRQQRLELNRNGQKVTEALNRLDVEFAARDDFGTFPQEYEATAQAEIEGILLGVADDDVREALGAEAESRLSTRNRANGLRAVDLEREAAAGIVATGLDAYAAEFALVPDGAKAGIRDRAFAMVDQAVEEDDLDGETGRRWKAEFIQNSAKAHAMKLNRTNPYEAKSQLEDDSNALLKDLDPVTRERLLNSSTVEIEQRERAAERAANAEDAAALTDVIDRIYNPANPKGMPTIQEIHDMGFGPKTFEHFAKIITKESQGKNTNEVIPSVVNFLYEQVHVSKTITSTDQLVPWIGRGLGTEEFGKLQADLAAINKDPLKQSDDRLLADFLSASKPAIEKSVFGHSLDPRGAFLYFQYRLQIQNLVREGQDQGIHMADLLDPKSTHFVGRILPAFQRTREQIRKDVRSHQQFMSGGGGTDSGLFAPVNPTVPERLDGESADAWYERTQK